MTVGIAVVGCGYWGKNLVRVFHQLGVLRWICDSDRSRLEDLARQYPDARISEGLDKPLVDPAVHAVVIATPAGTHALLAQRVLSAGRDVFVEKPLALTSAEGRAIVAQASRQRAVLMVGHVLQYHPAVVRLKELVDRGELGELYYLYSSRVNLGRVRQEENILWSFAPHDISVLLLLTGELPVSINVSGGAYLQRGIVDVTISTYAFARGIQGHIFVSWLHPFKEQRLVVVGSRKMAVFDDVATQAKLRIHDRGIAWVNNQPVPRDAAGPPVTLPDDEPLRLECEHFLECIQHRSQPRTDGHEGLRVLRVLEASQRSLEVGHPVRLEADVPADA